MNRHSEKEAQISLPAAISAYLGVTEPALFGVNVKYIYPFVAGMIGSGIAGFLSTTFNVQANSIGIGGLPGFMAIHVKYMVPFFVCMAVAIIVPFILTIFFRKAGILTKVEDEAKADAAPLVAPAATSTETEVEAGTPVAILSPLTGEVKELSHATDPVFAQGVMGQGVLIQPTVGELTAPVDATVSVLFPTKHAIGLVSTEGVELLIHIGMDTVNMNGEGFTSHVAQGDQVKAGDKLISFDIATIQEAGYIVETPVIITNQDNFAPADLPVLPSNVQAGDKLMTAVKNNLLNRPRCFQDWAYSIFCYTSICNV